MSRQTNLGGTETWTNSHNELKPKFFFGLFWNCLFDFSLRFFGIQQFPLKPDNLTIF